MGNAGARFVRFRALVARGSSVGELLTVQFPKFDSASELRAKFAARVGSVVLATDAEGHVAHSLEACLLRSQVGERGGLPLLGHRVTRPLRIGDLSLEQV